MKKIFILSIICLLLTGCTQNGNSVISAFAPKPLAVLSIAEDEELTIDVRDEFDPMSILAEVQEDAEVSYELDEENSKVVITLSKGDKVETLEKVVNIQYPLGEFVTDDIVVTKGEDFDVEEFLNVSDDVEVSKVLDEETGKLTVTLTEGDRVETLEMDVTVEAPKIPTRAWYHCVHQNNPSAPTYELLVDFSTGELREDNYASRYFTYISDNMGDYPGVVPYDYNHFQLKWNEDRTEVVNGIGAQWMGGADASAICTLTKVEY